MSVTVHGVTFASNRVLHSGLDGESGHFIAAYGVETAERDLHRAVRATLRPAAFAISWLAPGP
jgi:hypothetical protein